MKTPLEILKNHGTKSLTGFSGNYITEYSESNIIAAMKEYAKLVQEEQIKLCAYDFAKGTIAQGGEDDLISDVKRVIK